MSPLIQPHQQRVIEEHADLQNRLTKLTAFMHSNTFNALDSEEQLLLAQQHGYMHQFVDVLLKRIHLFKGMTRYTCHKQVLARPMNRGDYNTLRGWQLPADENGADEGYLVEYTDGGQSNHPDFKGYISWSPKDVFERGYEKTT